MKTYGNPPKTLLKLLSKLGDKIDEVGNEGDDGYWIHLTKGYIDTESGCHTIHQ